MNHKFIHASIFCIAAQFSPGQEEVQKLPESTVTATRFTKTLDELATPVYVITEEDLKETGSFFVLDSLRKIPGVIALPQGGMFGNHTVRLRGLPVEHTVIMIDGVEMNNSASLGASFDFGNLTSTGIERIEVLTGPQSSLYGADAIAGVIHVITKKGASQNHFSVSGGSFNTLSADFNLGAKNGNWTYSVSGQHFRTDGISAAASGTEDDGYKQNTGNFFLRWQEAEHFAVEAQFRIARNVSDLDDFDLLGNVIDDLDNVEKDRTAIFSITPIAKFLDGKWESKLPLSISVTDNKTIDDYSVPRKLENTQPRAAWINQLTLNDVSKLSFGAELENEEATINNVSAFTGPEPEIDQALDSHAFYGLLQYTAFDDVQLEVSGRSDITDTFGSEDTYRGAVAWKLSDKARVRAAYGTGFNTPTIALLYSSWGNPDLQAETSESYEFGVDLEMETFDTNFSLTWFHNDLSNMITWDNTNFRYVNIDAVETRGIELSATSTFADVWQVNASYTYTDTTNLTSGFDLGRTPRHIFAGSVSRSFLAEKLSLNLETLYYGERFDGSANNNLVDSHNVWNLAARYFHSDSMNLHARVDNLFDENYQFVRGYNTSPLAAYAGATFLF